MTAEQEWMIEKLARCTFIPGSFDKRFVRSMGQLADAGKELTPNQADYLDKIFYKYRRQIG